MSAATSAIVGDLRTGDTRLLMLDVAILLTILTLVSGTELLLRGRARLWARIAEVSVALGGILYVLSLVSGAVLPLAALWLAVTAGLIALAVLQPEVTT
ncbi:hypothetical protein U1839_25965 [Sphingomonas sp. RT2P30]|uniref:hypothetical protein n=1 Tax=Parasphingomonas halimpatiens TaxID=3096162 RepID=UPI002FCAA7A3